MASGVPAPTALLTTSGLTKSFGGVRAITDVDLEVEPGGSVGLVGPNGAGKTTLFNCVCGQLRQDSGTIEFLGTAIDRLPTFRRARLAIGRTYQRTEVFPELTVEDHLIVAERARRDDGCLWRDLCGLSKPKEYRWAAVDAVLDLVDLSRMRTKPVASLGLGTCRLVELARALIGRPTLLMADEPSSGLDTHETGDLAFVLRRLQEEHGMAVILVEHDLDMVGSVVDRTVVMHLGRVIASGPFDDVIAQPDVRSAYLG